jgi:hypothetical protein
MKNRNLENRLRLLEMKIPDSRDVDTKIFELLLDPNFRSLTREIVDKSERCCPIRNDYGDEVPKTFPEIEDALLSLLQGSGPREYMRTLIGLAEGARGIVR